MPITDSELTELLAYVAELEAQVEHLLKERLLYRNGPQALLNTLVTVEWS
jgi:hypothetical protein